MYKPKHFTPTGKKGGIAPIKIVAAVVVLLLLYSAYSLLQNGVTNITSMTSVSLQTNQTISVRIYGGDPIAIRLQGSTSSSTRLYVTRLPVLYGPVSSVSLSPANGANVSSNGTRIADMNLKLESSGPDSAKIDITPLPSALAILASSSISVLTPVSFYSSSPVNVTTTATTTISQSGTTTSPTTTIAQSGNTLVMQQALNLMNGTTVGLLMKHYKALYLADAGCTENAYDSAYQNNYFTSPPGYASFENASLYTPRDLSINETLLPAKNTVKISYSTVSPSPLSTGLALTAIINTSAVSYLKNVSFIGVYSGLNYSVLNKSYTFQNGVGSSCGAWIPPN